MTVSSQLTGLQSNLPTIQRFDAGDYKDAPNWFINKWLPAINLFTQPVYNILNQGVQVTANSAQEIYPYTLLAGAAATNNTFSFTPKKLTAKVTGLIIAQCYNASAAVPTAIGNPVTPDWYWTGSQVKVLAIYGLTSGTTYNFVFYMF